MFKKFKTKELVFIALMAALLFVVNFVIGSWIINITGITGASAFVTGITNLFIITLVTLVLRKFWAVILMYLIYGILAFPTNMGGGPPGFWLKIILLPISALFFMIPVILTDYKKRGFIIGLLLFVFLGFGLYLPVYYLLGMPEFDKMIAVAIPGFASLLILGAIGMWLGFLVWNRIKDKKIIGQIRG